MLSKVLRAHPQARTCRRKRSKQAPAVGKRRRRRCLSRSSADPTAGKTRVSPACGPVRASMSGHWGDVRKCKCSLRHNLRKSHNMTNASGARRAMTLGRFTDEVDNRASTSPHGLAHIRARIRALVSRRTHYGKACCILRSSLTRCEKRCVNGARAESRDARRMPRSR